MRFPHIRGTLLAHIAGLAIQGIRTAIDEEGCGPVFAAYEITHKDTGTGKTTT